MGSVEVSNRSAEWKARQHDEEARSTRLAHETSSLPWRFHRRGEFARVTFEIATLMGIALADHGSPACWRRINIRRRRRARFSSNRGGNSTTLASGRPTRGLFVWPSPNPPNVTYKCRFVTATTALSPERRTERTGASP